MFGSAILDVAIGMIFIYLLMALVVTSLSELIASWLRWRSKNLAEGLQRLLNSGPAQGLVRDLYNHPLVKTLSKDGSGPSYIPSRTFAMVLLDLISPVDPSNPRTETEIATALEKLPNKEVQAALMVLWEEARHEVGAFEQGIEIWFNNQMEECRAGIRESRKQ